MSERTFSADEVSAIVRERLAKVRSPHALADLALDSHRRLDELEARVAALERAAPGVDD